MLHQRKGVKVSKVKHDCEIAYNYVYVQPDCILIKKTLTESVTLGAVGFKSKH